MLCVFLWSSSDAAVCPVEQEVAEDHTWMWHRGSLSSQSFPQQHHHTLGVTRNERWEKPSSAHCSERDRDLRMSNNYIKQLKTKKKPEKLNVRVPTAAPLCPYGCGQEVLPVHTQHVGLWPWTLLWWLQGTLGQHQAWLPPGRSPLPD